MKRLLVTPAVAALLAVPALPAAHAAPATRYEGHCGFDTVRSKDVNAALGLEPDRYTGVAYAVVYSADDYGIPEPGSTLSITCEIYVNGVFADAVQGSPGTGVAVVAGEVSFVAGADDVVDLCDRVVLDGVESFGCWFTDDPQTPPRQVQGVLNRVVELLP